MLTSTNERTIAEVTTEAQNETLPSDMEIAARVLEIRGQWDLNERINRRDEAERRFGDLISRLSQSVAA